MCAAADLKLNRLLQSIDDWVLHAGMEALIGEPIRFGPTCVPRNPLLPLNLDDGAVRSIIWATGYAPDFSWLDMPVFDPEGRLIHDGGLVSRPLRDGSALPAPSRLHAYPRRAGRRQGLVLIARGLAKYRAYWPQRIDALKTLLKDMD